MEIRDTRNGDWHWVNNKVLACKSLTPHDKAVYSALCTFSGYSEIRPSFELLSERCSVPIRTVNRSIKNLKEAGFINIENYGLKRVVNIYILNKVLGGCINKCQSCTLKVPERHLNNASVALHIDKDIDNKKKEVSNETSPSYEKILTNKEGEPIEEVSPRKINNPVLSRINTKFREMCEAKIGDIAPLQINKQKAIIKFALKELNEKEIYDLFEWWFEEPQLNKEDHDLIQITQALSAYNISRYKTMVAR